MMGLPLYPDLSIPTWKEFCDDYKPHFLILPARAREEIILLLPMAMRRLALSVTRRWIKRKAALS